VGESQLRKGAVYNVFQESVLHSTDHNSSHNGDGPLFRGRWYRDAVLHYVKTHMRIYF
jgi:hypothetical protein